VPDAGAAAEDNSEMRSVEEALHESEERYRELFENANDIVFTIDLAGNFTSLNRAGLTISGYSIDEALGLNIAGVFPPDSLRRARNMIQKKLDAGGPTTYELDLIAKDGTLIPIEVSTRLIHSHGRPVEVQGIARDIRERRLAERELRRSEALFRTLITDMEVGVLVFAQSGEILISNAAARDMLGLSDEQLGGPRHGLLRPILREDGTELSEDQFPSTQSLQSGQPVRHAVEGNTRPERPPPNW